MSEAIGTPVDVFRNANLAVRSLIAFDSPTCVITFDSFTDDRRLERPAFGEGFFFRERVNAIHFISRDNDWYLDPEIETALAVVARLTGAFGRVAAYGSSMGAYAAIRFGGVAGAQTAIALSPQFSIDPVVAPFETRWPWDAARLDFAIERRLFSRGFVKTAYVFYDPYDLDRRHVELFRPHTELREIVLRNAGHPCIGFLSETGLLKKAVLDVLADRLDPKDLQRMARARRKESPQYLITVASRPRARRWRVTLAERAYRLAPGNFGYAANYAAAAGDAGRPAEAIRAFDEALQTAQSHPFVLCRLSEFFERRDEIEAAVAVMDWLLSVQPHTASFLQRRRHLWGRASGATARRMLRGRRWRPLFSHLARSWARRRAAPGGGDELSYAPSASRVAAPADAPSTTVPAAPPLVQSWLRHVELAARIPTSPIDLLLVGDSLVHFWPQKLWKPLRVFNFGAAADKTQHAIWRLRWLDDGAIEAPQALVMIGTNNLGGGDTPELIAAGVRAVVAEVRRVAADARVLVMAIPPCGPGLQFRNDDRRAANVRLETTPDLSILDPEDLLRANGTESNYEADEIHFRPAAYDLLTRLVRERFS